MGSSPNYLRAIAKIGRKIEHSLPQLCSKLSLNVKAPFSIRLILSSGERKRKKSSYGKEPDREGLGGGGGGGRRGGALRNKQKNVAKRTSISRFAQNLCFVSFCQGSTCLRFYVFIHSPVLISIISITVRILS